MLWTSRVCGDPHRCFLINTCMCQSLDVLGGHRVSGELPEEARRRGLPPWCHPGKQSQARLRWSPESHMARLRHHWIKLQQMSTSLFSVSAPQESHIITSILVYKWHKHCGLWSPLTSPYVHTYFKPTFSPRTCLSLCRCMSCLTGRAMHLLSHLCPSMTTYSKLCLLTDETHSWLAEEPRRALLTSSQQTHFFFFLKDTESMSLYSVLNRSKIGCNSFSALT